LDVKQLSYFQPDQIKTVVIQNHRVNDARVVTEPSFIRGNQIEYNSERDLIFLLEKKQDGWIYKV